MKSLDGMWDFVISPSGDALKGYREAWFADELSKVKQKMHYFFFIINEGTAYFYRFKRIKVTLNFISKIILFNYNSNPSNPLLNGEKVLIAEVKFITFIIYFSRQNKCSFLIRDQ